jgi:hypothetical protein
LLEEVSKSGLACLFSPHSKPLPSLCFQTY